MLDEPLVTVPEFRVHPTFLDTSRLVSGNPLQNHQDAALSNLLHAASQWVQDDLNHDVPAARHTELVRLQPDDYGRLSHYPEHGPVIAVEGVKVGTSPVDLMPVPQPIAWTEHEGRLAVSQPIGPPAGVGLPAAGLAARPGSWGGGGYLGASRWGNLDAYGELLVEWTYLAGWAHTQLAAPANAGASTVVVEDPTGVRAGVRLRLYTPAAEQTVTVTAVDGDEVTLARPLRGAQNITVHPAGMTIAATPPTVRLAVILYACALTTRPAPGKQDNFPTGSIAPASATRDPQQSTGGSGMIAEARRLLDPYRRIR